MNFKILILFISINLSLYSQSESKDSLYAKLPLWIQMIDDEKANYYEVIKAYEIFARNNPMPIRGKDAMKKKSESELQAMSEQSIQVQTKKASPEELALQQRDQEMIYQMRRYLNWIKVHASHVRADGSIPSVQEELEASKKQLDEQQKLESK